jgi:hypothetical protein
LLDNNVTVIITGKKSVHENSPKMSTRILPKMSTKIHPKRGLLVDKTQYAEASCYPPKKVNSF